MANTLFKFDRNTDAMRQKIRGLQMLREAVEILSHERAIEIQRRGETDGSKDTHYVNLASAGSFLAGDFGSASAAAKASFAKMDDLIFKLTTNASVSDLANAVADTCAQHGV